MPLKGVKSCQISLGGGGGVVDGVVEYKKFIYSGGPGRVGSLSFWWLPPF